MSCVEKRHMSHRAGSMLHHRFPNGFTDLFMDETDREVSTLTDRAFRSLCVGDDAVYNDELSYGFSPFSCHKPLVGEPVKKTHHKESKKQGQNKNDKNCAQPWKQQQQKSMSHMSSFLKVLSATEESCKGMLNKNGGMTDTNGESWDKSALRSIQRELSDFSSDYHTNLPDGHNKNRLQHQSGDGLSNKTSKDGAPPSGKSSKNKNGKSNVKLRKLNIKNFFLHSELSPFQTWRDFKQFPFGQEDTVLSADNIPKWYDLTFYKELTEAHRKENLHIEEAHSCQKVASEPPPPTAPKPTPPPPPPKVLLKPTTTPAEKRCSSEGGDGTAAPWRRNRSRAKSVIPASQPGIPPQENCSETVDESLFWVKKEARSVEVKAVEEVSSLASTPFSICQLMTPVIPSRQPTETSEILQGVLSPSALDLPIRPHSEAKLTPEPPIKRDSYKSLASSILFNLKDNRKRVKSRYSPPKFKTLEVPEGVTESPQSDSLKQPHTGSECNASGLSTPAILIEGQAVCSPVLDSNSTPTIGFTKRTTDRPLSDDYLLSNLLQTKWEAPGNSSIDEENPISPLLHSKKNKSPMAKKQNYPSLNLYRKANPVDNDMKYLHVPLSPGASIHIDQPTETNELSPLTLDKGVSPKAQPTNIGLSPNTLNVNKDCSPKISPHTFEKKGLSSTVLVGKRLPNVPDKSKRSMKDIKENNFGAQPVSSKEKDTSGQPICTMDVIKAAREAIHAVKNKAVSAVQSDNMNKPISYKEELREKQKDEKVALSKEIFSSKRESSVPENNNALSQSRNEAALVGKKGNVRKEPPPVPKRNFAKSDIQVSLDKQQTHNVDTLTNGDSGDGKLEYESVQKQEKLKHLFSARQNNYIKYQRYAETNDEQGDKFEEGDLKVNTKVEGNEERTSSREARDSEHIINDLHALKGLERARRGDRTHDNAKNKLGLIKIDEEARAKNDLISRELRNIKKGMLSMRGNTLAKREIFVNKEKEQIKPEAFTKIDSKVIVNKTLLNDNYDKAKMALEEIISDRQKKNTFSEQDANPILDENASNESYVTRVQQHKKAMRDSMADVKEKQNGNSFALKENDLKERLGDLRDHNHMRQILSQKDPKFGDPNSLAGRIVLPGMDKIDNEQNTILTTNVDDKLTDDPNYELEERNLRHIVRQKSEEGGEYMMNHNGGKKGDAPCVPPRSKRGGDKGDGSINMETYNLKDLGEKDIFNKNAKYGYGVVQEMSSAVSNKQGVDRKEAVPSQSEIRSDKEEWDVMNTANSTGTDAVKSQSIVPSKYTQSENRLHLSPEFGRHENNADKMQANMSPTREATSENRNARAPETYKLKRKAPLKPDHLNTPNVTVTNNLPAEDPYKIIRDCEEMHVDTDALSEVPMNLTSPLLLVNGVISQSPPDQSSLSSKSSYFSVESALYRNNETESNVYHSLENLYGEVGEVTENISQNRKEDSGRMEGEYYNFSDHESEPEAQKLQIKSPQKETKVPHKESRERKQGRENTTKDQSLTQEENNQTLMSPPNTFSPTLEIPALFKVKDNTFLKKLKKTLQPLSRRGSLSGSEKGEEGLHQEKETPELPPATLPATGGSKLTPDEIFEPKEISNSSKPLLPSPSNLHRENPNKPQFGDFLTVPQEEDRYSGVSPSSEGMESYATSAGDTTDDMGMNGSTCSGNESQTGLPKPPAVLPKSDKAVLKAIKLTTRRKKKEDAQKSPHRSTQSSSRNKVDRHKDEKSEQISSSKSSKSSERKDREKTEDGQRHSERQHGKNSDNLCDQVPTQRSGHNNKNEHHDRTDLSQQTQRQSHDSVENNNQGKEALSSVATERQGRSSNRRIREKPEQRHYSSDRVISNVPVYKALNDRPTSDRQFQRSQSYDRYQGSKVERRLSADVSVNEKLDPRTQRKLSSDMSVSEKLEPRSQRIEKSIMDELQQRGRAREKVSRGNPARRSHSIDAYSSEVPHPSTLSRQSSHNSHTSHTSQLSRQSSIEHAIVTQSFPMTQRKLLQDPDSGQYFFVDMPIQVKTKTFFDPETGSYVQLPVQPREGAVPQASPLEVLTPPMVVYHSFVPVPLSPMAQQAPIQAPHMTPEEFEQRHLERSRPIHYKERNPYLEPVYGQHDHMIGEFQGTEELDCPS